MTMAVDNIAMLHTLLARRDPEALPYLYQYARLLEVVLHRRFGECIAEEDRKDIVADALIRAWETGDRFDPCLSSITSWLVMRVVYQAREFLRRHGNGNSIRLDLDDSDALILEYQSQTKEQRPGPTIKRLLEKLPARRARIVEEYYYEERSVVEIARMLSISEAAVRSHLSHGRASLRQVLEAGLVVA